MKYSVVIPIYNSESYLESCLSSIVNQTYQDIEIILINDGSKDQSLQICKKYEQEDKRIKVISIKNSGVSVARNKGIENATGDFILFVDSDDYIDLNYIEKSNNYIVEKQLAYLKCAYKEIEQNKKDTIEYYEDKVFDRKTVMKEIATTDSFSSIGGVFIKRSIIVDNNITFSSQYKYAEDLLFNYKCISKCDRVGYYTQCYYFYIKNVESTSNKIDIESLKKYVNDNIEVIDSIIELNEVEKANKILKKINVVSKKIVNMSNSNYKLYKISMKDILTNNKKGNIDMAKITLSKENKFNKVNMILLKKNILILSYLYLKIACFCR